jgi:inosose dehydratase
MQSTAAPNAERARVLDRLVAGPISWGICEVPGWGLQLPVERVLGEMREVGIAALELGAAGWLPDDAGEVNVVLRRFGLQAVGAFVPLVLHDPSHADQARELAQRTAAHLAAVGARFFVTAVINDPDDWSRPALDDDEWNHIVHMLADVDAIAEAHGVTQVLHPHVDTLVETDAEVRRVLTATTIAFCLDTGHLTIGGTDPVAFAQEHADRVGLVHLKDVRRDVAARRNAGELTLMAAVQAGLFAPLGEGDVAIAEVVTALERAGYTGPYVLEQDAALTGGEPPPGSGPIRDVETSVAYLRSLDAALRAGDHSRATGSLRLTT